MIFIGAINKYRSFVRYQFCGWVDKEAEANFQNSIQYLVDEIMTRHTIPRLDFDMYIETLSETILEIMFDSRYVTPERIEDFLNASGILVRRNDPFYFKLSIMNRIFNLLMTPIFSLVNPIITKMLDFLFLNRNREN